MTVLSAAESFFFLARSSMNSLASCSSLFISFHSIEVREVSLVVTSLPLFMLFSPLIEGVCLGHDVPHLGLHRFTESLPSQFKRFRVS